MSLGKIFGVFDISGSGLSAQRRNLEVRAENIANAESVDRETGLPYQQKEIRFEAIKNREFDSLVDDAALELRTSSKNHIPQNGISMSQKGQSGGVEASVVQAQNQQTKLIYAPDHPMANADGYLEVSDVDSIGEMVKLVSAARAYEANATLINSAKDMFKRALEI